MAPCPTTRGGASWPAGSGCRAEEGCGAEEGCDAAGCADPAPGVADRSLSQYGQRPASSGICSAQKGQVFTTSSVPGAGGRTNATNPPGHRCVQLTEGGPATRARPDPRWSADV